MEGIASLPQRTRKRLAEYTSGFTSHKLRSRTNTDGSLVVAEARMRCAVKSSLVFFEDTMNMMPGSFPCRSKRDFIRRRSCA